MMARMVTRARLAALALGLAGATLLPWLPSAPNIQVQAGQRGKPEAEGKRLLRRYYDVSACIQCHAHENDYTPQDNPKRPPFTAGTEIRKREPLDKHVIAYQVLDSERAQRMGKLLKHKIPDIKTARDCLSCHSIWLDSTIPPDSALQGDLTKEEGVSCVACHGSNVQRDPTDPGWSARHAVPDTLQRDLWRKKTRQEKETDFGMIDLWDPVRRARLCASCHIGNLAEGKVVTHEMYAAGHPALPGFEPATFSNQMPRHWQHLREKVLDPKRGALIKEVLRVSEVDAELEEIHLLAAGSLVALEASMELMAGQTKKEWPELARFDCYACHHELTSKSWRKERGYPGTPGRVPVRPWITALVELGIVHASVDDAQATAVKNKFEAEWQQLQNALDRQPFGDPKQVADSADRVKDWATEQLQVLRMNQKKVTRASPRRLWERLLAMQKRKVPDYDSARQIGWALEVLARNTLPGERAKKFKDAAPWHSLDAYLNLTLPAGKTDLKTPPPNMPWLKFRPAPLEKTLPDALERINSYEPAEFRKRLAAFLEATPLGDMP